MVEGLLIEENCVILPSDFKIEGPNSKVNEKEFAVDIQVSFFTMDDFDDSTDIFVISIIFAILN